MEIKIAQFSRLFEFKEDRIMIWLQIARGFMSNELLLTLALRPILSLSGRYKLRDF